MNQVTALRKRFGIDGEPLQIVIEDTSLNATGTRDTKHIAESWLGIFEAYAEMRGWPRPIAVPVNSWRAAFIGRQWAPKEVEGEKERRKWIKDATVSILPTTTQPTRPVFCSGTWSAARSCRSSAAMIDAPAPRRSARS
jgi:hypothetical protein